jgi:fused signal recognition particle receptor
MVAAADRYRMPIHAIGLGEGMNDLRPFDPAEVAAAIAGTNGGGV